MKKVIIDINEVLYRVKTPEIGKQRTHDCPLEMKDEVSGKLVCFLSGRQCHYKDRLNCSDRTHYMLNGDRLNGERK